MLITSSVAGRADAVGAKSEELGCRETQKKGTRVFAKLSDISKLTTPRHYAFARFFIKETALSLLRSASGVCRYGNNQDERNVTSGCVLVCLDMCDFLCDHESLSVMTQQWLLPGVAPVHLPATGAFFCMCMGVI